MLGHQLRNEEGKGQPEVYMSGGGSLLWKQSGFRILVGRGGREPGEFGGVGSWA